MTTLNVKDLQNLIDTIFSKDCQFQRPNEYKMVISYDLLLEYLAVTTFNEISEETLNVENMYIMISLFNLFSIIDGINEKGPSPRQMIKLHNNYKKLVDNNNVQLTTDIIKELKGPYVKNYLQYCFYGIHGIVASQSNDVLDLTNNVTLNINGTTFYYLGPLYSGTKNATLDQLNCLLNELERIRNICYTDLTGENIKLYNEVVYTLRAYCYNYITSNNIINVNRHMARITALEIPFFSITHVNPDKNIITFDNVVEHATKNIKKEELFDKFFSIFFSNYTFNDEDNTFILNTIPDHTNNFTKQSIKNGGMGFVNVYSNSSDQSTLEVEFQDDQKIQLIDKFLVKISDFFINQKFNSMGKGEIQYVIYLCYIKNQSKLDEKFIDLINNSNKINTFKGFENLDTINFLSDFKTKSQSYQPIDISINRTTYLMKGPVGAANANDLQVLLREARRQKEICLTDLSRTDWIIRYNQVIYVLHKYCKNYMEKNKVFFDIVMYAEGEFEILLDDLSDILKYTTNVVVLKDMLSSLIKSNSNLLPTISEIKPYLMQYYKTNMYQYEKHAEKISNFLRKCTLNSEMALNGTLGDYYTTDLQQVIEKGVYEVIRNKIFKDPSLIAHAPESTRIQFIYLNNKNKVEKTFVSMVKLYCPDVKCFNGFDLIDNTNIMRQLGITENVRDISVMNSNLDQFCNLFSQKLK